ncbi:hypothetical protein V6Z12_D02G153000 [Gossypium hirsutum]
MKNLTLGPFLRLHMVTVLLVHHQWKRRIQGKNHHRLCPTACHHGDSL